MDHYTSGRENKANGGGIRSQSLSMKFFDKLRPSEETRSKMKTRMEVTKKKSSTFLKKLKALSSQMILRIKERMAQVNNNSKEPVKPYETVVMTPAELNSDLINKQVLHRYDVNAPAQPRKGFVPNETIREQRRARRRQRQLKKSKQNDEDAPDNKDVVSTVGSEKIIVKRAISESSMPGVGNKAVTNPLFGTDEVEDVEDNIVVPMPVPVEKPNSSRVKRDRRIAPSKQNPLFAEL